LVRRLLDLLYLVAGGIAGFFLAAILVLVTAQIVTRALSVPFPGGTDYAGYCMAAASFFALAHTFRAGAHIRVAVLLQHLPAALRRPMELVCLAIAGGLAWYFAWFAIKAVMVSRMLNDISQGQDATPLWIPQLAMAAGTVLFAVALTDHFVRVLTGADPALGDGATVSEI
jgi:TRAP-type C4-dicarboxylate transport system permease small subunit